MSKLTGKVAIVTGAGQGLGKAYALAFAKEGAAVTVADLNGENAQATANEINNNGGKAIAVTVDVSNIEQVKETVSQTVEAFGTINILVNNAQGIVPRTPLVEVTVQNMEFVWRTGTLGTLFFMQECFPYLKENSGRVINVCSDTGILGHSGFTAYGAAKEAIRSITRTAATEWGSYGITVNVVSPGALTPAAKRSSELYPEQHKAQISNIPLGRLGDPDHDIAPGVVFLASDDSRFITGQTIALTGGHSYVR